MLLYDRFREMILGGGWHVNTPRNHFQCWVKSYSGFVHCKIILICEYMVLVNLWNFAESKPKWKPNTKTHNNRFKRTKTNSKTIKTHMRTQNKNKETPRQPNQNPNQSNLSPTSGHSLTICEGWHGCFKRNHKFFVYLVIWWFQNWQSLVLFRGIYYVEWGALLQMGYEKGFSTNCVFWCGEVVWFGVHEFGSIWHFVWSEIIVCLMAEFSNYFLRLSTTNREEKHRPCFALDKMQKQRIV